jgi:hypothetical protein
VHAFADARVDSRSRYHADARAVCLVFARVLVPIGVGVAVFVEVPDPDESVLSAEDRFRIADVGCSRIAPPHLDRLIAAVGLDQFEQHPHSGRPGCSVPQLNRVRQRRAGRIEEPDVRTIRLSLSEVEAIPVEQHGHRVVPDVFGNICP